jgi:hypothetical protein
METSSTVLAIGAFFMFVAISVVSIGSKTYGAYAIQNVAELQQTSIRGYSLNDLGQIALTTLRTLREGSNSTNIWSLSFWESGATSTIESITSQPPFGHESMSVPNLNNHGVVAYSVYDGSEIYTTAEEYSAIKIASRGNTPAIIVEGKWNRFNDPGLPNGEKYTGSVFINDSGSILFGGHTSRYDQIYGYGESVDVFLNDSSGITRIVDGWDSYPRNLVSPYALSNSGIAFLKSWNGQVLYTSDERNSGEAGIELHYLREFPEVSDSGIIAYHPPQNIQTLRILDNGTSTTLPLWQTTKINDHGSLLYAESSLRADVDLLFVQDYRAPTQNHKTVLTIGQELFGSILTSVSRYELNNQGDVAFQYTLQNGKTGLAIARPEPPKHIIVLTHGWQPNGTYDPTGSYLPEVEASIRNQLSDEISTGEVVLLTPEWTEAFSQNVSFFTDPIGSQNKYETSLEATSTVGNKLAQEVMALIPDDIAENERPTIHFIGHSLGTLVNANSVSNLNEQGIKVDRVTLLDTPKNASREYVKTQFGEGALDTLKGKAIAADDAFIFRDLMPYGSVEYVENFYADRDTQNPFLPNFGQPIAGAGPCTESNQGVSGCSGFEVEGADHNEVHYPFYDSIVRDVRSNYPWLTPAKQEFGNADILWDPRGLSDLILNEILNTRSIDINFVTGNSELIFGWEKTLGEVIDTRNKITMIAHSPVAMSATMNADSILSIAFDIDLTNADIGTLSLYAEGNSIWSIPTGIAASNMMQRIEVPVVNLFGEIALQWLYNTEVTGSSVDISNLAVLAVYVVPEPASLYLIIISFLLIPHRHWNASAHNTRSISPIV